DFAQNIKSLEAYETAVDSGHLPIERGMRLSDDDLLREHIIQSIMCYGRVEFDSLPPRLASEHAASGLAAVEEDGLIEWQAGGRVLQVTPRGRFFLRNIAMSFDAYLGKPAGHTVIKGTAVPLKFSKTV